MKVLTSQHVDIIDYNTSAQICLVQDLTIQASVDSSLVMVKWETLDAKDRKTTIHNGIIVSIKDQEGRLKVTVAESQPIPYSPILGFTEDN